MGKRSSAFSKLARAAVASSALALSTLGWVDAFAAPAPTPSLAPVGVHDPAFLSLPVAQVESTPPAQSSFKVGDSVVLKIRGEGVAPGMKLAPPPGAESLSEQGWQLLAGESKDVLEYEAVALKPGAPIELPPLSVLDAEGKAVAKIEAIPYQVSSAIKKDDPKPKEAVGFRPPTGLRFPFWLAALLLLVAAVVLAALTWYLNRVLQRRKAFKLPAIPAGPPKTEDQQALDELDELEKQGLVRRGQYKMHYFRVSEIAKRYIGKRYGFDAPESTSRELVTTLEESKLIGDEWIDRIETLFEKLDRAKFTDHVPEAEEGDSVLAEVRKLVLSTRKPAPVTPILKGGAPGAS